jgi:hypothetical protein
MKIIEKIESIGVLIKEESIQTVEHFVLDNTLVLESIEPFPGYHGENLPREARPDALFFITDKPYPIEVIFRASQQFCSSPDYDINACPVEITLYNTKLSGIRIRGLKHYASIADIQHCFIKKNIGFMKFQHIKGKALMSITKIILCAPIDESVFKDLTHENTYYLTIPYHFEWAHFLKVTESIKHNMDNNNFDGAIGFLYLEKMMEFIRIFDLNPGVQRLKMIRQKYLDKISVIREIR